MVIPKKAIMIIIAVVIILILIGGALPLSVTGNTLTIYVKNNGVAVSGATVRLSGGPDGTVQTGITGASGYKQFTNLDAGQYNIQVTSAVGSATQQITLSATTSVTANLEGPGIILPGVGVLKGTTHSQEGNVGLPGVLLTATGTGGVFTATSDSNADYYMTLDEGIYTVKATYGGFESIEKTISIITNSQTIQNFLIINAAASLNVRIIDSVDSTPINYAILTLNGAEYQSNNLGIIYIKDFAKGTFPYTLTCTDYISVSGSLVVAFGYNDKTIKMVYEHNDPPFTTLATVSGHVTKIGSSEPIMNAVITFTGTPGTFTSLSLTDGTYSIVVPAGSYTISATAQGFNATYYTGNPLVVAPNDVKTNINLQMSGYVPPEPPTPGYEWTTYGTMAAIGGLISAVLVFAFVPAPPKIKGFVAIAIALGALIIAHLINIGGIVI
jgi:hypothetical protein